MIYLNMQEPKSLDKRFMPLICLIGIFLNFFLSTILTTKIFDGPLYLDTVFTVSLTLIGGLFWGMLCGALSNILIHTYIFWSWEGYLFVLCNVATAFITWLFIRFFPRELALPYQPNELHKSRHLDGIIGRLVVLILLSFTLCIAMSILGGLITVFISYIGPYPRDPTYLHAPLGSILFSEDTPILIVEILSRIPVNIVDRLITALAGYGAALLYIKAIRRRTHS